MPAAAAVDRMSGRELRESFLLRDLFEPGEMRICCTDLDRMTMAGVVPAGEARLPGIPDFGTSYFTERRELGIINLGGPGVVDVGGKAWKLEAMECLYVGTGNPKITFAQDGPGQPVFYLVSCPAHKHYPTEKSTPAEAVSEWIGESAAASRRRITKFIHEDGISSCQLVMGFTELETGSVWNTMPPHTHSRRSEVYLYNGLGGGIAVHLMGEPSNTRSLIVRDREAALSPPWSIHTAAGTAAYSFIWAMAGENQSFADMDPVAPGSLY